MDPFSFAPIAGILDGAYVAVEALVSLIAPVAGQLAAATAVLLLTLLVRTALIPVGVSQVKAERARRRIAPKLQELQAKHKKNPQLLQRKTAELYRAENVSPFAGFLPALAQLPVISLVYALFERSTIHDHGNALLVQQLFGVPLGTSFFGQLAGGHPLPGIVVYLTLFTVMAATAWVSRRTTIRLALPPAPNAAPSTARINSVLSWLPFLTIVFAAITPLAATLYLTVTTAWTLVERMLLRRRHWVEAPGLTPPPHVTPARG